MYVTYVRAAGTYIDVDVFCVVVVLLFGTPRSFILGRGFILLIIRACLSLLKSNLPLDCPLCRNDCKKRRLQCYSGTQCSV